MLKSLNQNLGDVGFIVREKNIFGNVVKCRCGRDFIYYSLNYFFKDKFSPSNLSALKLEKSYSFGLILPWWLTWTQLQFIFLPRFLRSQGLNLQINGNKINNFLDFFLAITVPNSFRSVFFASAFAKDKSKCVISADDAIVKVQKAVDAGLATGIDISMGLGGLMDHVMFVYGYDEENFYIFDSHIVRNLNYEKVQGFKDDNFYMKLPKSEVKNRWTKFGRVWVLKMVN